MRPAVPILVVAAALLLAGCGEKSEPEVVAPSEGDATTTARTNDGGGNGGGGGGGQQASPEEAVEDTVVAVIGGGDPASACGDLVTERYVRTAYGDTRGCRAAVPKQGSFRVQVSAVRVNGSKATAKAEPAGGPNKGETIAVKLVDEKGWRVDSALSNAPAGP